MINNKRIFIAGPTISQTLLQKSSYQEIVVGEIISKGILVVVANNKHLFIVDVVNGLLLGRLAGLAWSIELLIACWFVRSIVCPCAACAAFALLLCLSV